MKIYKYFSHQVLELVFQRSGYCGIKCSLPKVYNDPYELFLGVDTNIPTEYLATYRDIVQELPQFPTTCFSKSPIVAPMWAHYAMNHTGFVLEFDTDAMHGCFKDIAIRDIQYKLEPDPALAEMVERVAVTMKPRHAVWLRQAVLTEAYFSKYQDWAYEQECRLVDRNQYVEEIAGNSILFVPTDCVTAIIVGSNFPKANLSESKALADAHGLEWFQLEIGKSFPKPFLTSQKSEVFIFQNGCIEEAVGVCGNCSEPLPREGEFCAWCAITDIHAENAARGNPFRVLDSAGHLNDYFAQVQRIEKGRKKR